MRRTVNIHLLCALLVGMLLSCSTARGSNGGMEEKPNILFILVDDLGWSDVGYLGNKFYATPNIDKLAQEGFVFTNAYAPAANCAPSRACILTGKNTPRHGIYTVGSSERGKSENRKLIPTRNTRILDTEFITIAEALKKHGYTSASMGKWHLGEDPREQGFDVNIGGSKAGHPRSYFSPYRNDKLPDGKDGEYLTDRLTDEAIHFIDEHKAGPFFLYLPYFTVHTPLQGKPELVEKYQRIIGDESRYNARFGAMVESMDQNVGRLIAALKNMGLEENTLLIFYSDNGGLASISSQAPLKAGKGSYYEGGIRVPCIFSWPKKIRGGQKSDYPITGMDIFPTLMEVVQDKSGYALDGRSLLPLVADLEALPQRPLFWHFPIYLQGVHPVKDDARDSLFRTRPGSVVREGKWKLHEYFEYGEFELYDLELDPGEQKDVSAQFPDVANRLKKMLEKWRKDTNAPVPTELNPEYVPAGKPKDRN